MGTNPNENGGEPGSVDRLLPDSHSFGDVGGRVMHKPKQLPPPVEGPQQAPQIDAQDLIKDAMIKAGDGWAQDENNGQCSIKKDIVPTPDIQMLDVYRELAFDNPGERRRRERRRSPVFTKLSIPQMAVCGNRVGT